jgi:S1-C subfamily serine protease
VFERSHIAKLKAPGDRRRRYHDEPVSRNCNILALCAGDRLCRGAIFGRLAVLRDVAADDHARADLTEAERTTIKLFQSVSPSVVYVFARTKPQNLFSQGQEESEVQMGTGIVWDAAGHVITNYHVIKGSDQFAAHLPSGESVSVRVVSTAPTYDLAVLQLERIPSPLHPIALGSFAGLQVGQSAFAIGNPMVWSRL